MNKLLIAAVSAVALSACATSYQPATVGVLSCQEIQDSLGALKHERQALGLGSLLGGIVVAIAAGPWVAVPVVLLPTARGNRGEFALSVAQVIKECEG